MEEKIVGIRAHGIKNEGGGGGAKSERRGYDESAQRHGTRQRKRDEDGPTSSANENVYIVEGIEWNLEYVPKSAGGEEG